MSEEFFELFEIVEIQTIGVGTRVCLDFTDVFDYNEGVLVGNTGHGFIKVLAETRKTETYPPREFRINTGAVHQYIYLGDDKTCYLSEVKPGMKLPIYGNGVLRYASVGRVKMEKREFIRVVCRNVDKEISFVFQDSDSVYLQSDEDVFLSMKEIMIGSNLYGVRNEPGRHLGEKIEEEIIEK